MKTVFDNDMVAHVWAQGNQEHGKSGNGNFHFRGDVIYSYSTPVARRVRKGGKVAYLVTSERYSNTTSSKHMPAIHRAVNGDFAFNVPDVGEGGRARGGDNVAAYIMRYEASLTALARSRDRGEWLYEQAQRVRSECFAYCDFFDLARPDLAQVSPETIAAALKRSKKSAQAKAAATKEHNRLKALELEEAVKEWLAGANAWQVRQHPETFLRVSGEEIETSKGARFPVEHGKLAFRVIRACRERGTEWARNGHTIHLGHFAVDKIEKGGDVKAGCHFVKWDQIARVAVELGLLKVA